MKYKLLMTDEGESVLMNRSCVLTSFKAYLSDNKSTYDSYVDRVGYTRSVDIEFTRIANTLFFTFDLLATDFISENYSIFIGATDLSSGNTYNKLLFLDKNNSFIKEGDENINWYIDSAVQVGTNTISLENTFRCQFIKDVDLNTTIPYGKSSKDQLFQMFKIKTENL